MARETYGDLAGAVREYEAALAMCERCGARVHEVWAAHALARVLRKRGGPEDRERARELALRAAQQAASFGVLLPEDGVLAPASSALTAPLRDAPECAPQLTQKGELWELVCGPTSMHLEDSKGVRYLAQLMAEPGRSFHVIELSGGSLQETDRSDHGPVIDHDAVQQYKRRVAALREELEDAAEGPRALALRNELEALEDQLAEGLGLGGRLRRGGSNVERARINVQRRLRDSLRRIEAQEPELARRIERALKTGVTCVYDP
jgi:hypothetical protein